MLPESRSAREVCAELGRSGAQRLLSILLLEDQARPISPDISPISPLYLA